MVQEIFFDIWYRRYSLIFGTDSISNPNRGNRKINGTFKAGVRKCIFRSWLLSLLIKFTRP